MPRVLFVCTANICRSPVAAGLLQSMLDARDAADWEVASAGTWAAQTRGASQFSIDVMGDRGIDIRTHQSRMVTEEMLERADLVLCMESGHVEALRAEFPRQADKIFLLTEMVGLRYSISDPYGQPREEYERMAEAVESLLNQGLPQIMARAAENARS
jgi:protein-tyrosine phosphatase